MTFQKILEINEKLKNTFSADIFDVLDAMGYPHQCLDIGIKPLRDDMKISGPAFTILGTREPLYDDEFVKPEFDNFAMFDYLYKGCVVVVNAENSACTGNWGEMMSYGARNCGAAGVVIDGGTRDKAGILKIDNWSCFARYTTPVESKARWRPRELQKPIYMSGELTKLVRVNPGDWIFGDCDAVMVIPADILEEVAVKVEDLSGREVLSRIDFAKGEHIRDVVSRYGRA